MEDNRRTAQDYIDVAERLKERICERLHESWIEAYNRKKELEKIEFGKSSVEACFRIIMEMSVCENYMRDFGLSNLFYDRTLGDLRV